MLSELKANLVPAERSDMSSNRPLDARARCASSLYIAILRQRHGPSRRSMGLHPSRSLKRYDRGAAIQRADLKSSKASRISLECSSKPHKYSGPQGASLLHQMLDTRNQQP